MDEVVRLHCGVGLHFRNLHRRQLPIKVGVISAWDWPGGQGGKRGSMMAIRDINAAGGLLGRQVEGIYYDNKGSPDEAKRATERALYQDKVDAIAGFWRSDLAIMCQPLVMEAKKLFLLDADRPALTYERIAKDYKTYKYTFNLGSNTITMLSIMTW
jgi:branched-chain amino acid transport system substrate-binding protein